MKPDHMKPKDLAEAVKAANVIDMAFTFTAMGRVFEKGSKAKIMSMLEEVFSNIDSGTTRDRYSKLHNEFCSKFIARRIQLTSATNESFSLCR